MIRPVADVLRAQGTPSMAQLLAHHGYTTRPHRSGTEVLRDGVSVYTGPARGLAAWMRAQGHRVPGGV